MCRQGGVLSGSYHLVFCDVGGGCGGGRHATPDPDWTLVCARHTGCVGLRAHAWFVCACLFDLPDVLLLGELRFIVVYTWLASLLPRVRNSILCTSLMLCLHPRGAPPLFGDVQYDGVNRVSRDCGQKVVSSCWFGMLCVVQESEGGVPRVYHANDLVMCLTT